MIAASVVASAVAHAQVPAAGPTVAINPLVTRFLPNGNAAPLRPQNLNPTGVSFADCESDVRLHFSLTLGGLPQPSLTLQAWVGGTDCTPLAARTGTTATCWPAMQQAITQAQVTTADIRAQDIVAHITDRPPPVTYSPAAETACQNQIRQTSVSVYFMWVDATGNPQGTAASYPVPTALIGPSAPTGVNVGELDTGVQVTWTAANDSTIQGYNFYCDPPPGHEGAQPTATFDAAVAAPALTCTDASGTGTGVVDAALDAQGTDAGDDGGDASGDASIDASPVSPPSSGGVTCSEGGAPVNGISLDAATSVGGQCQSNVLIPGGGTTTSDGDGGTITTGARQTIVDPQYLCGTVGGGTSTSFTIGGMKNGYKYAIAMAALDNFQNVGPLSQVVCGTPTPVSDFWDGYRGAGGQAGGGFCALEGAGMPAGTAVMAVGMLAAAVALLRRRLR